MLVRSFTFVSDVVKDNNVGATSCASRSSLLRLLKVEPTSLEEAYERLLIQVTDTPVKSDHGVCMLELVILHG